MLRIVVRVAELERRIAATHPDPWVDLCKRDESRASAVCVLRGRLVARAIHVLGNDVQRVRAAEVVDPGQPQERGGDPLANGRIEADALADTCASKDSVEQSLVFENGLERGELERTVRRVLRLRRERRVVL